MAQLCVRFERLAQFQHPAPDARLHRAQRGLQRIGNFSLSQSTEKRHFDRLLLLGRELRHRHAHGTGRFFAK